MDYYRKMIDANEDWEYAGTFADRGISGTSVKRREQFLKMMEACEGGSTDLILTKSISRFARNTVDSAQMLRRLRDLNVEVYFQKENIWTSRSEGDKSRAVRYGSNGLNTQQNIAYFKGFRADTGSAGSPCFFLWRLNSGRRSC